MIGRSQLRERRILAVKTRGLPLIAERQGLIRVDIAVLQRLGEHLPRAGAPDLATEGVEHDEFVRLTIREIELDGVRGEIRDLERELHVTGSHSDFRRRYERGVGAGT